MRCFTRVYAGMYSFNRALLALMLGIVVAGTHSADAQDILVALPDTSVLSSEMPIPILVDDISGHSVQGFYLSLTYDSTHFMVEEVKVSDYVAKHFTIATNLQTPGRVLIAAAKASPAIGRGVLLTLNARFHKNAESVVGLEQFAFNEGFPLAIPREGRISNKDAPIVTRGHDPEVPEDGFHVLGHYPNPLRTTATLVYSINKPAEISLQVMDVTGREVLRHAPIPRPAGPNQIVSIDASGLSAGIYLYRLTARASNYHGHRTGMLTVVR